MIEHIAICDNIRRLLLPIQKAYEARCIEYGRHMDELPPAVALTEAVSFLLEARSRRGRCCSGLDFLSLGLMPDTCGPTMRQLFISRGAEPGRVEWQAALGRSQGQRNAVE